MHEALKKDTEVFTDLKGWLQCIKGEKTTMQSVCAQMHVRNTFFILLFLMELLGIELPLQYTEREREWERMILFGLKLQCIHICVCLYMLRKSLEGNEPNCYK